MKEKKLEQLLLSCFFYELFKRREKTCRVHVHKDFYFVMYDMIFIVVFCFALRFFPETLPPRTIFDVAGCCCCWDEANVGDSLEQLLYFLRLLFFHR